MDKLAKLLARCKCGVFLTVNEHRDYYDTAAKKLAEYDEDPNPPPISAAVRAEILRTDNIVDLHFYPDTPIGFYHIVDASLEAALDRALATLDECDAENARFPQKCQR